MTEILFDQYQRYKKTQEIIEKLRSESESFNILEVGANEHRNLERFLPNDKITYLDIQLPEELQKGPQYILGDATQMELLDDAYDLIVALDVFEHIPKERRKSFIDEINRVAKKAFILMGPFDTEGVAITEKSINAFFKTLIGVDHPWLVEHIENGLPNWEETRQYLKEKKIQFVSFEHGTIGIWEKLMRYHFLSVYSKEILEDVNEINHFYNEKIYPIDRNGVCYRKIIIGSKKEISLVEGLLENDSKVEALKFSEIEAQFFKKLCIAYAERELLILKDNHINNLQQIINSKDNYIKEIGPLIELKETHIKNIEAMLTQKERLLHSEEEEVQLKDNHIRNIEDQIQLKDNHIRNIEDQIQLKDNHIRNIEEQTNLKESHISNIEKQIVTLNRDIDHLRKSNLEYKNELDAIYRTVLGKVLRKAIGRIR